MNKKLTCIITLALLMINGMALAQDPSAHVTVGGSVFGGGNKANVGGKSTVLIDQVGAVIEKDVYGGGALANVDTINKNLLNTVTLTQGTVEQDIYGGGLGDASHAAKVYGPVQVIMYGGQARNVFGCNNVNGAPQSTVNVTINDGEVSQSVFGGGNLAAFEGSPVVNINDGEITENVFGGGNLADVLGSTTVNINGGTITLDVYGGGALANVGASNSDNTVVNVLGGTVNGNVYGGGLGRKQEGNDPTTAIAAAVNGVVTVNIGALTGALDGDGFAPSESVSGEATIRGYVFGCNNTNGSPKDNVTVNIYKTYRTTEQQTSGTGFTLSQVFGGGNQANYEPATTGKKATVHIWTCDNTIQYVYGGGNAADLGTPSINSATDVIIDGGRIEWVFGGGNGYSETNNHTDPTAPNYNPGANVNGNTQVTYHAGNITYVFGGSNQWGNVSGSKTVDILSDGTCTYDNHITELYGGNNEAPSTGDISLTMGCPEHLCDIGAVYGGSRNADINGDVTLTIEGGQYDKVFGGNNIGGTINGNVTLNLYGGTINSAFGGNNAGGEIKKSITVNLLDAGNSQCPLQVDTIYGGGQEAAYTPDLVAGKKIVSPVVNLWHGTVGHAGFAGNPNVAGCVFGGGKGSGAIVTAHPKVVIGDTITGHDVNNRVTIYYDGSDFGNIFGGGNAAAVDGIDSVLMLKVNSEVGNLFGGGNMADADSTVVMMTVAATVDTIFGGGNKAGLDGAALVEVAAGTVRGGVYGGSNASGTVSGDILVNITGGTIGTDDANSNDGVFGGGFGNGTSTSGNVSVTIKGSSVNVYGDVYGGSAKGSVNNNDNNKTIVTLASGTVHGDLYGGGLGDGKHAALVKGAVQVAIYGGTVDNVFGCNNAKGAPESMVQVIVNDTTAAQSMKVTNVFGGGNLAAYTGTPDVDILNGTINGNVFGGGNEAGVGGGDVTMSGGIVKKGLYGGCNTSGTITTDVTVNVEGGTVGTANTINGAVYGGGLGVDTKVKGVVTVTINGGTINNDVYGGSAKGMVNCNDEGTGATSGSKTYVTLKAGTINGSLYGGGHGIDKAKAHVWGPVQVTVNAGSVNGSVYGCNNASGAPQSTVKVDVYGTDTPASGYALANVFGGGNQAPFGGTPEVTIHNCENSIEFVYGGGNAASVEGTNVKVYGGNTIGNVFGGGNGTGVAADFVMVKGNVLANIYGGTIGKVFGGNNTSGVITGSATLNINKKAEVEGNDACKMYIGEVYGGGNLAAGKASAITIGCTGDWTTTGTNNHTNHNSTTNRIGYELEGIGTVYGGANMADISNDIILNINSGIVENVFGGNNTSGEISGTITVNIEKTGTCDWYVGNVFGGGNLAAYSKKPAVNIKNGMVSGSVFGGGNEAGVGGGNVTMTGGTVLVGLYGGCNTSGEVGGDITVDITGGTIGSADSLSSPRYITADVFGGGYGSATSTSGNVEVNINGSGVNIYGDVYGGSALGNVNNEATDKTTVNILEGILHSEEETIGGFIVYHGGNVYGGGLGRKDDPSTSGVDEAVEAKVYGEVTVNIGEISGTGATGGDQTGNSYSGNATIGGSVYGCNNTNGSPQQDVTVNIYATAHTDGNGGTPNNTFDGNAYAIANVFGGGNEAHYTPSVVKKKATVNIFGCDNTIGRTFGGGNAAHVGTTTVNASVETDILGGRIGQVFGGGNGERGSAYAANIYGNDTLKIHGGSIGQSFGGSNQNGTIFGAIDITVDENGCGSMEIDEFFCGGNFVDIIGGLTSTISCAGSMHVNNLYGGCNMADIYGDVELNLYGGEYINVFGGSKGRLADAQANAKPANILKYPSDWETNSTYPAALQTYMSSNGGDALVGQGGNVTLNLYGGTMTNAYGGSNVNGNIEGVITVNLLDAGSTQCPLQVDTIYGSGCDAAYTPSLVNGEKIVSPIVNLWNGTVGHGSVKGCVFGGGKGSGAVVTAHPKVMIGDTLSGHENNQITIYYNGSDYGNIFGGGNAAAVDGIDSVLMLKGNSLVGNLFGGGNAASAGSSVVMMEQGTIDTIFGGGNLAGLTGTSKIVMTNGTVHKGIFGGCNASGTVSGEVTLEVNGGAVGAENALAYGIFGGGYGSATTTSNNISVTLNGTTVYGDLYGGSALGQVNGSTDHTTTLNISGSGLHGTIYGGGKGQASPAITAITNGNVVVNYNTANTYLIDGIYGGANIKGNVKGNIDVNVNANVGASGNSRNIFGGGLGQNTMTEGNVTVTIGTADGSKQPVIYGDIYGGSALGNVNDAASDLTKIDFLNGTLHGNIFGGGLGQKTPTPIAAKVNGSVEVNISNVSQLEDQCHIDLRDANIYGCNNTNGSPQANVTVNVWKTGFTTGDYASQTGTLYAIDQVFGGGKQADYLPENAKPDSDKKTTVYIHECKNTIRRVFSGGDAAAATGVACTIEGGRFDYIFGGGNGEATAANIGLGGTDLLVEAGIIEYLFGGSNTSGTISGEMRTTVTGNKYTSGCDENITEFFGGGNLAPINTSITTTMDCGVGTITNIYGGAKQAAITGDITLNIKGGTYTNIFGGSQGIYGGTAANITGNVTLNLYGGTITNAFGGSDQNGNITGQITVNVLDTVAGCPLDVTNIYGGGNVTPYTPTSATISPLVNVMYIKQDAGVKGNVFGGGLGKTAKVTANPVVNIGYNASTMSSLVSGMTLPSGFPRAKVTGNVFGGGSQAPVTGSPTVNAYNGSVTKVYGGGLGATAIVTGNPTVIVNQTSGQTLTVTDVFGGGDAAGVTGNTDLQLKAGTVTRAFGGGNVADITGTTTVKLEGATAANIYGGGNEASVSSTTSVTVSSGNATAGVYGGCNTSGNVGGNVTVNVTGGTIGATGTGNEANVHGGGFGNGTSTSGDVNVTINGASATIWGDVYGGSAKGHVNDDASDKTNVTLTAGTIHGDLYGGGLGDNTYAALVNGAVQVTVNGGSVTGSVYGCNNANGAPQSTVKVDIYGTDTPASGYALGNVFGGGNLAGYPGTPEVTIHNCNNSIEFVYGGGNAAPVAATNVKVYGGNTIGNVFGGGNGTGVAADFVMVTGNVLANIYGGTIGKVFGGNNSSGLINGTVTLNVNKETETGHSSCDMKINEVYGGGNMAAGNAGTINIGCTGDLVTLGSGEHYGIDQEGIRYVYGGANQAGINNDIVLNINSGIVENVFGGNNTSGTIAGSIKVNINKDNGASCFSDWYVGNVYGGGNLAKYTAPTSGSYTGKYPEVNILNGLVSGDVFGGGLGQTGDAGQVTGDPQVTVNGTDASVNGSVYGGGSLAPTKGNPLVTLTTGTVTKVFGGGKAADVDGTPTVDINGGQVNTGVYGGCDSQGDVKGKITVNVKNGTLGSAANLALATPVTVDVYGGGYGSATTTSGDVEVNIGECTSTNTHNDFPKIYGDVYGGSALGKVNGSNANTTIVNVLNGRLYTFAESATTANGQTYYKYHGGNVYGGGLGDRVGLGTGHSNVLAEENGKIIVNIGASGGSRALAPDTNIGEAIIDGNVYGCNNTNGSPQDDVTVNIYRTHREETDIITYTGPLTPTFALNDVFGGGNQADYNPTATGKKSTVMIHGCHNTIQRVFGGSNAAASGSLSVPVEVNANINGGRFYNVFGGGNGEVSAANIYGDVKLEIHGGIVNEFYIGSNQDGSISGSSNVTVDQSSGCDEITITEFYCGGKYADYIGNINAEISCSQGLNVNYLYGGCKEAHVIGNVHLTVKGGTYDYIFGGSRGTTTKGADIQGDVVLDVYGGTVNNAIFGGSNVKGAIGGTITVNVEDKFPNGDCALEVSTADVYGGGNQADYPGTASAGSPLSGTITHTPPYNYPAVNIKNATVKNVFGGGLEADVIGNPQIKIKKGSKIRGNVYGGGNMGEVIGDPKVIINGKLE